jgi:hypothetical protein
VPGLYAVSACKWIRIEVTTYAANHAYWQNAAGQAAPIKTESRIDVRSGRDADVGAAQRYRCVEVRVDGGPWRYARQPRGRASGGVVDRLVAGTGSVRRDATGSQTSLTGPSRTGNRPPDHDATVTS